MNDFTVSTAVFCDDARREVSGKDILIGVYTSGMNIPILPAQINVCFWMEIMPRNSGNLSMEFKLEIPGKKPGVQLRLDAIIEDAKSSFGVAIPQVQVTITEEGEIKFSTRAFGQEKWRTVKRVKVIHKPVSIAAPPS